MEYDSLGIIESPAAGRMLKKVTPGFYARSRTALWMFEAVGRELDAADAWTRSLHLEAFPLSCTWGIGMWEDAYGIKPDGSLPLEFRRMQAHSVRLQNPPMNPARVEALLAALTGNPVKATEGTAPYTFSVMVEETAHFDHRAALRKLRQVKPSHLSFTFDSVVRGEYAAAACAAIGVCEYIKEGPAAWAS